MRPTTNFKWTLRYACSTRDAPPTSLPPPSSSIARQQDVGCTPSSQPSSTTLAKPAPGKAVLPVRPAAPSCAECTSLDAGCCAPLVQCGACRVYLSRFVVCGEPTERAGAPPPVPVPPPPLLAYALPWVNHSADATSCRVANLCSEGAAVAARTHNLTAAAHSGDSLTVPIAHTLSIAPLRGCTFSDHTARVEAAALEAYFTTPRLVWPGLIFTVPVRGPRLADADDSGLLVLYASCEHAWYCVQTVGTGSSEAASAGDGTRQAALASTRYSRLLCGAHALCAGRLPTFPWN
ncbi:hypothetical protein EON67_08425, partial [archaeon]